MRQSLAGALALAAVVGSAQAHAQPGDRFVSFTDFIAHVASARAEQYVGQPGNLVSGAAAFEEMRRHILRMYDGVHVRGSYVLNSQPFDCVPVAEQPSLRRNDVATPPPAAQAPGGPTNPPNEAKTAGQVRNQKLDRFGNKIGCEDGTIPMRRITLEDLSRFRTLREFFQK